MQATSAGQASREAVSNDHGQRVGRIEALVGVVRGIYFIGVEGAEGRGGQVLDDAGLVEAHDLAGGYAQDG